MIVCGIVDTFTIGKISKQTRPQRAVPTLTCTATNARSPSRSIPSGASGRSEAKWECGAVSLRRLGLLRPLHPSGTSRGCSATCGTFRSQAFFPGQSARTGWLRVFPALKPSPYPPGCRAARLSRRVEFIETLSKSCRDTAAATPQKACGAFPYGDDVANR